MNSIKNGKVENAKGRGTSGLKYADKRNITERRGNFIDDGSIFYGSTNVAGYDLRGLLKRPSWVLVGGISRFECTTPMRGT